MLEVGLTSRKSTTKTTTGITTRAHNGDIAGTFTYSSNGSGNFVFSNGKVRRLTDDISTSEQFYGDHNGTIPLRKTYPFSFIKKDETNGEFTTERSPHDSEDTEDPALRNSADAYDASKKSSFHIPKPPTAVHMHSMPVSPVTFPVYVSPSLTKSFNYSTPPTPPLLATHLSPVTPPLSPSTSSITLPPLVPLPPPPSPPPNTTLKSTVATIMTSNSTTTQSTSPYSTGNSPPSPSVVMPSFVPKSLTNSSDTKNSDYTDAATNGASSEGGGEILDNGKSTTPLKKSYSSAFKVVSKIATPPSHVST